MGADDTQKIRFPRLKLYLSHIPFNKIYCFIPLLILQNKKHLENSPTAGFMRTLGLETESWAKKMLKEIQKTSQITQINTRGKNLLLKNFSLSQN